MKQINLLILMLLTFGFSYSCSGQTEKKKDQTAIAQNENIEVYYFHTSRRCVTCKSVEAVSDQAVEELYGDEIPFTGVNLDEPEGKQKAQEMGVGGQSLLIVKGDTKINITNEGFMYARTNPEKLKEVIADKVNSLL